MSALHVLLSAFHSRDQKDQGLAQYAPMSRVLAPPDWPTAMPIEPPHPAWANPAGVASRYDVALRRLLITSGVSLPRAVALLDQWHDIEVERTGRPACAADRGFFRDFWPWYVHGRA